MEGAEANLGKIIGEGGVRVRKNLAYIGVNRQLIVVFISFSCHDHETSNARVVAKMARSETAEVEGTRGIRLQCDMCDYKGKHLQVHKTRKHKVGKQYKFHPNPFYKM